MPISDDQMKWEAWEYLLTLSEAQLAAMGAPPNTVTAEYDVTMHVRSGAITVS